MGQVEKGLPGESATLSWWLTPGEKVPVGDVSEDASPTLPNFLCLAASVPVPTGASLFPLSFCHQRGKATAIQKSFPRLPVLSF